MLTIRSGLSLVVSEIFGPTFQGEGPTSGRHTSFVRLGRCNLSCSFCDTPYTWDWERFDPAVELRHVAVEEVLADLDERGARRVVVTGGEPLLQESGLTLFLRGCSERGWSVEIETAGTLAPSAEIVARTRRFNVSPKLASSGNSIERRYRPNVLRLLDATGKAAFKFVATNTTDLEEIERIVDACGLSEVWVMPEGTDGATVVRRARELADAVLAQGWNLTLRQHILLWGDQRSR